MYLLGYDIGSSSVKASIVDVNTGNIEASAFFPGSEAPIISHKAGWAEQDPQSWWDYLRQATAAVLDKSRLDPADIKAIGISYQMHGLVAVDRDRQPLRPAIIWCDSRGVPYGEKAFSDLGADKCLSHLLNSPGNFTASKLRWVKENEPELFERIYKIMLPGDYIAMRLTDRIATTVTGLSECMLWDFATDSPAAFLMDYFGFPESIIPEIVPTFGDQGHLTAAAAAELGLKEGTPVTYRAGDQPNNALSLNVFEPGEIASTAGTSGVVYGINGEVSYDPLSRVNTFAHVNHRSGHTRLGIMNCINGTGILNSWIRRNVAPEGTGYAELNELASRAPVGAAGVSILPFGNGAERVLCNRETGCSIHGLNFLTHGREHLARAAQEGIVFAFQAGIDIMKDMGMEVRKIHAGHANMFLSPLFRHTLANVSGAVIELYDTDGAAGAARGAGIGAGIYASPSEAFATLHVIERTEPDAALTAATAEAYALWQRRLKAELSAL